MGGAITALNVTDQAVILVNGTYGPEVGTMNAFRNTDKLQKPVIFLVNQLDKEHCHYHLLFVVCDGAKVHAGCYKRVSKV